MKYTKLAKHILFGISFIVLVYCYILIEKDKVSAISAFVFFIVFSFYDVFYLCLISAKNKNKHVIVSTPIIVFGNIFVGILICAFSSFLVSPVQFYLIYLSIIALFNIMNLNGTKKRLYTVALIGSLNTGVCSWYLVSNY